MGFMNLAAGILMVTQRQELRFERGFEDGFMLIPRYLWNGWPNHNVALGSLHATLLYYIGLFVGLAVFLLVLTALGIIRRRRRHLVVA